MNIPVVLKDLIDRVNATGGKGLSGIVTSFALFNRAGSLVADPIFMEKFESLVEDHEPKVGREANLRGWMEEVLAAFLGFKVEVPEPPKLNRKQSRALKKYGFRMFFIPAITEEQYPEHIVTPEWGFGEYCNLERIPLPGRWIAIETIERQDVDDDSREDDVLMPDIKVESRFGRPCTGNRFPEERGSVVDEVLPLVSRRLGFGERPEDVMVPSIEEWNFLGNLFIWLVANRDEKLPDLGDGGEYWEWCRNSGGTLVGSYSADEGSGEVKGIENLVPGQGDEPHDLASFRIIVHL